MGIRLGSCACRSTPPKCTRDKSPYHSILSLGNNKQILVAWEPIPYFKRLEHEHLPASHWINTVRSSAKVVHVLGMQCIESHAAPALFPHLYASSDAQIHFHGNHWDVLIYFQPSTVFVFKTRMKKRHEAVPFSHWIVFAQWNREQNASKGETDSIL